MKNFKKEKRKQTRKDEKEKSILAGINKILSVNNTKYAMRNILT